MPSPFPGMNPYLEHEDPWHDFHERFITTAAGRLERQVGTSYIVKIDEHAYIHELPSDERRLIGRGDVLVAASPSSRAAAPAGAGASATPVQVALPVTVDIEQLAFVEVRERQTRKLVTVLELLSPSNKAPGPDRAQYLAKRMGFLSSGTHFVEIDLLRGKPRLPVERLPPCDYYALVSRADLRPQAELWPIRLRDPLPRIPVPLRTGDNDVYLDLQQMLHDIYDDAGYAKYIYEHTPTPALSAEDDAWARGFLPH